MLKSLLKRALPYRLRAALRQSGTRLLKVRAVRAAWHFLPDLADRLAGRADPLTPPRRLVHAIGRDFRATGDRYLRYFIDLAGLRPDERVLDVGCGAGRMARPLTGYLRPPGGYEGFDIMPDCVAWCRSAIAPRFPHFRFQHVSLYNREYNPSARQTAAGFRFPYEGDSFDFAFLTSVFTHLLPADLHHYLGELVRVLRPGGRCLATFFLLNEASEAGLRAGLSPLAFRRDPAGYATTNPRVPEEAIAFDEPFVRGLIAKHGAAVTEPVRYGSWSGRADGFEFQDVMIFHKPA